MHFNAQRKISRIFSIFIFIFEQLGLQFAAFGFILNLIELWIALPMRIDESLGLETRRKGS